MKKTKRKFGFTIVELLTVMSVIAILMGLLVPALNLVRRMATNTKQKAQFHSISVALDMFNGEFDGYPDSAAEGATKTTVGAQKLAEALIGRDFLGYDTASSWNAQADLTSPLLPDLYTDSDDSIDRRKGPYLNPENTEAFTIEQLYRFDQGNVCDGNSIPSLVLTDAFRVKDIFLGGKKIKAGSPILYYKADVTSKIFDAGDPTNSIYNVEDNYELLALGKLPNQDVDHPLFEDLDMFYEDMIRNPKITNMDRPYNQTSYILISAGFDGLYGTRDDIFNFGE